jgi:hypothetical protein
MSVPDDPATVSPARNALERYHAEFHDALRLAEQFVRKANGHSPVVDEAQRLRAWAETELKGIERRVIELLVDGNGKYRLADMAVDQQINWSPPYDDAWNSVRRRLNRKLTSAELPYSLRRSDGVAVLSNFRRK